MVICEIWTHLSSGAVVPVFGAESQPSSIAIIERQLAVMGVGGRGSKEREWNAKRRIKRGTFACCVLWCSDRATFTRLWRLG